MRIALHFAIVRDPAVRRYAIDLVAVSPTGEVLGPSARVHEPLFNSPAEAARRVAGSLRGMLRNPAPGFFPCDFVCPGEATTVRFGVEFVFEQRGGCERYGIEVVAVDPSGNMLGRSAQLHDPAFGSLAEAVNPLVSGMRHALRSDVIGPCPDLSESALKRFAVDFVLDPDPASGRYGVHAVFVSPTGEVLGSPVPLYDAIFSGVGDAAQRILSGLLGAIRHPIPGFFEHDFLYLAERAGAPQ